MLSLVHAQAWTGGQALHKLFGLIARDAKVARNVAYAGAIRMIVQIGGNLIIGGNLLDAISIATWFGGQSRLRNGLGIFEVGIY
jgi:hypothetical protein